MKRRVPLTRRRQIAFARVRLRRTSAAFRALPDFLIIGTQRGGTSSLYKYLGAHPGVIPSVRKETEYFTRRYGEATAWYRAHMPTRARLQLGEWVKGERPLTFEATPDYLFHPHAARRAKELLPDARLIVLLRDPVDRAMSHYLHMRRLGFEEREPEEAVLGTIADMDRCLRRLERDPTAERVDLYRYSYVARGRYSEQLERWMQHFEREQFLIMPSSRLYEVPSTAYADVLDFLGMTPWQPLTFANHSYPSGDSHQASKDVIPQAVVQQLRGCFETERSDLEDVLGRPFSW